MMTETHGADEGRCSLASLMSPPSPGITVYTCVCDGTGAGMSEASPIRPVLRMSKAPLQASGACLRPVSPDVSRGDDGGFRLTAP